MPLCLAIIVIAAAGAAQALDPLFDILDEEEFAEHGDDDPLEGVNRSTFRFNESLDRWILDPITLAYRTAFPRPVRRSVARFFENLNAPVVALNDGLQGHFNDFGITTWRFLVNSTVGVVGLFDPATALGVVGHRNDLGITLARYRVPSGPYLVLPVLGPSTARDAVGTVVGIIIRPSTYLLSPADQLVFTTFQGGGSGLAEREGVLDSLRILQESSLDYYASMRSAYLQNRRAEVRARIEGD